MTRWLRILVLGCPVCRRRRRHLSFCRYRAPAIDIPPIMALTLGVTPLWMVVGFVLAGWLGLGVVLIVAGILVLILAAVTPAARRAQLPAAPPRREEVVGALYPREMRHRHRVKGVCTHHCGPKAAA